MLRVYVYQFVPKLFQKGCRYGRVVHKKASASGCRKFATNDTLGSIIFKLIFFEKLFECE